ncbi:hypothetical protein RL72_00466 [Microbacterium azadirachtae]|uniref:Uncharacterized protein n=1 Tax=Microbacterium azadirachtae TaxID=582680 RepID=A0A0F0L767_9MICO|nr:hypothetical protein RL72_00466 [Microbacterium azadirachtae]
MSPKAASTWPDPSSHRIPRSVDFTSHWPQVLLGASGPVTFETTVAGVAADVATAEGEAVATKASAVREAAAAPAAILVKGFIALSFLRVAGGRRATGSAARFARGSGAQIRHRGGS